MKVKLQIQMQIVALAVAGVFPWIPARAQGSGSLQSQLEAKYSLTKPTDDKSDIVTAGAVLVLEKDKLIMYPVSTPTASFVRTGGCTRQCSRPSPDRREWSACRLRT